MERIEFAYCFKDDEHGSYKKVKEVRTDENGEGVSCRAVCDAFIDFMEGAGYSIDVVFDYFKE